MDIVENLQKYCNSLSYIVCFVPVLSECYPPYHQLCHRLLENCAVREENMRILFSQTIISKT